VFDTQPALADMAGQIRACRASDGLTLQQLATRSGVAASTIHKVESQQMVPTVSVLLKIAKGLGRRPEELIRDEASLKSGKGNAPGTAQSRSIPTPRRVGLWHVRLARDQSLSQIELGNDQRAMVVVEHGDVELVAGDRRVQMHAGDCVEVEGGRSIRTHGVATQSANLTVIVSPPGGLDGNLEISG
jgi:transcriptional regulator with XRE-family HTH domain